MTYREKIQQMHAEAEKLYDDAGGLRDYAIESEKDYFNELRKTLSATMVLLSGLDNLLGDRANMKL